MQRDSLYAILPYIFFYLSTFRYFSPINSIAIWALELHWNIHRALKRRQVGLNNNARSSPSFSMVHLLNLPNELLEQISNEVWPTDLKSYVLSCRGLASAATSALSKHSTLRKQYGRVTNHVDSTERMCLFELLKTILVDPRIGAYVECLALSNLESEYDVNSGNNTGHLQCDGHSAADIEMIISATPMWTQQISHNQRHLLRRGEEDLIVPPLLHYLPNLLTLEWQAEDSSENNNALCQMKAMCCAESFSRTMSMLKSVKLDNKRPNDDIFLPGADFLGFFLALPSVERIQARSISIPFQKEYRLFRPKQSNVRSLDLSFVAGMGSRTHYSRFFEQLIAHPQRLETFKLQWARDYFLEVEIIRKALLEEAAHSLMSLTLRGGGGVSCLLSDLRDFQNLQQLETEMYFLFSRDAPISEGLNVMLPSSLEQLCLYEDRVYDMVQPFERLSRILQTTTCFLTKLRYLEFHFAYRHIAIVTKKQIESLLPEYYKQCLSHNVKTEVHFSSIP